ncbi:MAG: hypothetical protein HY513_02750 [Candidatus Aenigmarchaeota archaeon]|nr:hypothetical protein [Candidatus Aenigmarchaeota archaeon]
MKSLAITILVLALVAGCVNNSAPTAPLEQPDRVDLKLEYRGCRNMVSANELSTVTSWSNTSESKLYNGLFGANEMNCDYYETVSNTKYHVGFSLYVGGYEQYNSTLQLTKTLKNITYSSEKLLGIASFSSKPQFLLFIDKQAGVVVKLQMDANNILDSEDWENLISIGSLIESKLN